MKLTPFSISKCLLLSLASATTAHASACDNATFARPLQSQQQIVSDYSRSVFPITAGGNRGTAYLVDVERGYAITAGHVVQEVVEGGTGQILAGGPVLGPGDVALKVVAHDFRPAADFAILQLPDPTPVKSLKALEISSRVPQQPFEAMTSLSWGQFPNDAAPLPGSPEFQSPTSSGTLRFSEHVAGIEPGDSGSPLIDGSGMVIGTLKQRISVVVTEYVSLRRARRELTALAPNSRVSNLHRTVVSGVQSQQDLIQRLSPSQGDLSNFDLALWVGLIAQNKVDYVKRGDLITCPIIPAYDERDVLRFAIDLIGIVASSPADEGRQRLHAARTDALVGDTSSALAEFAQAQALINRSIQAYESANPDSNARAECYESPMANAQCEALPSDAVLAGLYRDLSISQLYAARLVDSVNNRSQLLADAERAAAMAVKLTDDSPSRGISYSVLGDIYLFSEAPERATAAYAAAYDSGLRVAWLDGNFEEALNEMPDREQAATLRELGIENATRIEPSDLVTVEQP